MSEDARLIIEAIDGATRTLMMPITVSVICVMVVIAVSGRRK
jgi:hypothetical protein